ncbi:50S ribosomal protein L25 [compost metagenome]
MITSFQAEQRIPLSRTGLKHLRQDGRLPAHIFSARTDQVLIHIAAKDFERWVRNGKSGSVEICLETEDRIPVSISEIQRDPVSREIIHVDFKRA